MLHRLAEQRHSPLVDVCCSLRTQDWLVSRSHEVVLLSIVDRRCFYGQGAECPVDIETLLQWRPVPDLLDLRQRGFGLLCGVVVDAAVLAPRLRFALFEFEGLSAEVKAIGAAVGVAREVRESNLRTVPGELGA